MDEATLERSPLEICKDFPLGEEARALLVPGMRSEPFLNALEAAGLYVDACRFLAHALPKREAVGWACACVRQVADPQAVARDTAFAAAERWVRDPSENNRQTALEAGKSAEPGTLGGLAALAAGTSGGSLAPPKLPAVPPGKSETARALVAVVLLAAVQTEPEKAAEKFAGFVALGKVLAHRAWALVVPTRKSRPTISSSRRLSENEMEGSVSSNWVEDEEEEPHPNPPAPKRNVPEPPASQQRASDYVDDGSISKHWDEPE